VITFYEKNSWETNLPSEKSEEMPLHRDLIYAFLIISKMTKQ